MCLDQEVLINLGSYPDPPWRRSALLECSCICIGICVCGLCVLQADSDSNVLDGPETVSYGLADMSAGDREL